LLRCGANIRGGEPSASGWSCFVGLCSGWCCRRSGRLPGSCNVRDLALLGYHQAGLTKLAGPVKGTCFDAYVIIDIYSRYIVGAVVQAQESGPLTRASQLTLSDPAGGVQL